jgi:hypothetical protein
MLDKHPKTTPRQGPSMKVEEIDVPVPEISL